VRRRLPLLLIPLLLAPLTESPAHSIRDVYKRVKASVVVIETEGKAPDPISPGRLTTIGGMGSGVLISADGEILTAAHVVQTADRIHVTFLSGESIPARVKAAEPGADVALLQLERRPGTAQVAELADSDRVEVGDVVFVIGAPLGITHSLSVGHISARRTVESNFGTLFPTEVFQTDAAINQGNSGGPMFDEQGRVIGLVSYIISQSGGWEGLGFVITSNMARKLLIEDPSLWSGLQGRTLQGVLAKLLNVPQSSAVLVETVGGRSPANHLGIRGGTIKATIEGEEFILGGDIILEVMGVKVSGNEAAQKIRTAISSLGDGDEMTVKVLRGGEIVELKNFFFPDLLLPGVPTN
jgi:S1-C subfamily serine protease